MSRLKTVATSRRGFLGLAGGAAALSGLGLSRGRAQSVQTNARIVILGAGAAGTDRGDTGVAVAAPEARRNAMLPGTAASAACSGSAAEPSCIREDGKREFSSRASEMG